MIRTISGQFCRQLSIVRFSSAQIQVQTRNLFTRDFLGVTVFQQRQQIALKELAECNADILKLRSNIQRNFGVTSVTDVDGKDIVASDNGPSTVLLSDDVRKMIYTSKTLQDVEDVKLVLRKFVVDTPGDNVILVRKKGYLFKDFMALCHTLNAIESAKSLWHDQQFMEMVEYVDPLSGVLNMNMPSITDAYLDLLYENKKYDEVLQTVHRIQAIVSDVPVFVLTVAVMSCLRMNTNESLDIATKFYSGSQSEKLMRFSRFVNPFALLACHRGNYSLAFEALSFTNRKSQMRTSLLVHVLCKLNRISEALDLLEGVVREAEAEDRPLSATKMSFPVETVMTLTKTAEASSDKALKVRLASIFARLDRVATINDLSLLRAVTADIDCTKGMKYRREKNWQRLQKQKTVLADEEAADLNDDENHRHAV